MKKIITTILTICLIASLTACKETPESAIITEKSTDILLEKAEKSDGISDITEFALTEKYSFELEKEYAKLTVAATVSLPITENLSIYKVSRGTFTQEQADAFIDIVVGDAQLYSRATTQMEYDAFSQALESYKEKRDNGENGLDETIEQFQEIVDYMSKNLEEVPISSDFGRDTLDDNTFLDAVDYQGDEIAYISVGESEDTYANFFVTGANFYKITEENADSTYEISTDEINEISNYVASLCSDMELINIQKGTITTISIGEMTEMQSDIVDSYELTFARNYNGVSSAYFEKNYSSADDFEQFSKIWNEERITVVLTNEGIVSFDWVNPYEQVSEIVENANMLEFTDVMDVFNKMIFIEYADLTLDNTNLEIEISDIELAMKKIDTANEDEALIVPVWSFTGSLTVENSLYNENEVLLMINAIDGTIISL